MQGFRPSRRSSAFFLSRMSDEFELPSIPASSLLEEIDAQQDDLLQQLDQLNDRLECLLRECSPAETRPLPRAA